MASRCLECNQDWSEGTEICPICQKKCIILGRFNYKGDSKNGNSKIDEFCFKYLKTDALGVFLLCMLYWFFAFWIIVINFGHIYSIIGTILGNILFILVFIPLMDWLNEVFPPTSNISNQQNHLEEQPNQNFKHSVYFNQNTGQVEHVFHKGTLRQNHYVRTNQQDPNKSEHIFKIK